jgi:hypothetical protein
VVASVFSILEALQPERMIKAVFLILMISITALGCGVSSTVPQAELEKIIKSKLGSSYAISYNVSKDYALCQQTSNGDHANRKYKYIVVKIDDHSIAHQGSFQNGYAKWSDNNSIEVSSSGVDEKTKRQIIPVKVQKS